MMDNKNIPVMDQSWFEAEKMLNKHFRKKRLIILFFALIIPAFIAGLVLMVNHSKKMEPSAIVSSQPEENSVSINNTNKNNDSNSEPSHAGDVIASTSSTQIPLANQQKNITPSVKGSNSKQSNSHSYSANKSSSIIPGTVVISHPLQEENKISNSNYYSNTDLINDEKITLLNPLYAQLNSTKIENSVQEKTNFLHNEFKAYSKVGWEMTVYGGYNYVQKTVSTSNDWGNYLQHRKNEEDPILAPYIGIYFSRVQNSFSLNLGLEYAMYGEETNYFPYSNQLSVINNTNWQTYWSNITDIDTAYVSGNQYFLHTSYLRLDSSLVSSNDTIEVYQYDPHMAETNGINKIYYVEMPIEVSYCLSKGKMGFGLSGGLSPAMLVHESGYYVRPDGRGVESLSEMESFRKYILNARMSVDFYYRIAGRTKLTLRPQVRANLNSVFESNYGVNQKYYSAGVLFGISYMLN